MAETVGTAVVKVIADGRGLDRSIKKEVEDHDPAFRKAGEHMGDVTGEGFSDAFGDKLRESLEEEAKSQKRSDAAYKGWVTRRIKETERLAKAQGLLQVEIDTFSLEEAGEKTRELTEDTEDLGDETEKTTEKTGAFRRELDRMKSSWEVNSKHADTFGNRMGRIFGKGARNNFINIVGIITEGLTTMTGKFLGLLESMPGLNRIFGGGGGFFGILSKGATSLIGVVVAFGSVILAMGLMTAAASGLLAILTSLISVLAFGLVGALAGAAGALVPLTFGIGTLVLAIANLSDAQKNKLEPVGDAFHELGDAAAEGFGPHLTKNVEGFVRVLEGLEPVVRNVGDAMGRVLDDFMQDLKSPQWTEFGNQIGKWLPGAVESLGTSFTNALGGAAGVFEAMIPMLDRFLGWLEKVTDEFNRWANSKEGQEDLADFFQKAGDSARSLKDLLVAAGDAIFGLLDSGNEKGIGIVDRMTGSLNKFSDWIKSDEGQQALEDWFQSAEDLAIELGDLKDDIIELFDELDSEQNRQAIRDLTDLMGDFTDAVTDISGPLTTLMWPLLFVVGGFFKLNEAFEKLTGYSLLEVLNPAATAIGEIADALGKLDFGGFKNDVVTDFTDKVVDLREELEKLDDTKIDMSDIIELPGIGFLANKFGRLGLKIKEKVGEVNLREIFNFPSLSSIAARFSRLGSTIMGAIGRGAVKLKDAFNIPSLSSIATSFSRLANEIISTIGRNSVKLIDAFNIPSLSEIAGKFAGLGGQIANQIGDVVINVVPRILGASGIVAQGQQLGSWRDAAEAAVARNRRHAHGTVLRGPQIVLAGEDGPEAIVPLNRPLNQVDPAVRWLSAIAQGIAPPPSMGSGGIVSDQRPIEITVLSPAADPRAVAVEAMNHLVAVGY